MSLEPRCRHCGGTREYPCITEGFSNVTQYAEHDFSPVPVAEKTPPASPPIRRFCTYCGAPTSKDAFCYETRTYSCGEPACDKEMDEHARDADERAREDAAADDYGRYR